jgi:hypothetical protein
VFVVDRLRSESDHPRLHFSKDGTQLELPNPLAGYVEKIADLFKRLPAEIRDIERTAVLQFVRFKVGMVEGDRTGDRVDVKV